jgi:hypothetical protein
MIWHTMALIGANVHHPLSFAPMILSLIAVQREKPTVTSCAIGIASLMRLDSIPARISAV